jgi:hypothetical protein
MNLPIFEIYKEKVQAAWDTEDLRLLVYEICDPPFQHYILHPHPHLSSNTNKR